MGLPWMAMAPTRPNQPPRRQIRFSSFGMIARSECMQNVLSGEVDLRGGQILQPIREGLVLSYARYPCFNHVNQRSNYEHLADICSNKWMP